MALSGAAPAGSLWLLLLLFAEIHGDLKTKQDAPEKNGPLVKIAYSCTSKGDILLKRGGGF